MLNLPFAINHSLALLTKMNKELYVDDIYSADEIDWKCETTRDIKYFKDSSF